MESYGEILKEARNSKNFDLDTVARELSITRQYLEGLENEDSSVFPGEPYFVGFLKNYAEYLGVNVDSVLTLYRNKRVQESPVPEGLIVRQRPSYFIPLIIGACVFAAGLIILIIILCVTRTSSENNSSVVIDKNTTSKKYELSDKTFSGRLYVGDQIIFPAEDGDIVLTVCDTLSSFGLQAPVGTLYTDLAEEAELDIDGDVIPDLIVYVSDISSTDVYRGAEVRLRKRSGSTASTSAGTVNTNDIPLITDVSSPHKQLVVFEDNRAYPFTLNASFRGPCIFRYEVDRRDKNESYFTNGEIVTMTASNGVRLWMSNCNTVKFTITADAKKYDLEIGKDGQVLVEDIKWIKDTDGKYKLVVIELD